MERTRQGGAGVGKPREFSLRWPPGATRSLGKEGGVSSGTLPAPCCSVPGISCPLTGVERRGTCPERVTWVVKGQGTIALGDLRNASPARRVLGSRCYMHFLTDSHSQAHG